MSPVLALSFLAGSFFPADAALVTPVPVFTDDPYANATPPDYKLSYALNQALTRAQANPDAYATPYVSAGVVIAPVTTADVVQEAGRPLVLPPQLTPPDDGTADLGSVPPPQDKESVPAAAPAARTTASGADATVAQKKAEAAAPQAVVGDPWLVYPKVKMVGYSANRLEAIKDEIIALPSADLPGVDQVTNTYVQVEQDRVVVEATQASLEFRTALASRYGTDAVAVRLVADPGPDEPSGRLNDTSVGGFYGGASIENCTNAFSWRYSGYQAMLTAGHCTSLNGSVYTPAEYMGTVVKDTWANSSGTVFIDGQSTYHGDVSLIKLSGSKTSAARIYVGSKSSSSSRAVAGMWSRRAGNGDQYCTGGKAAGELCGWKVNAVKINVRYSSGTYARNLIRGTKQGQCIIKGDSGGPVYTVNSAGKVVAKGVNSGSGGGGSDNWGGALDPCRHYFTDIYEAYYGFPGVIATS
ncbi:trypsin-like serine protease [Sphaerisporangium sp. NPDC005289]|uniref:trypsin-like serine protease n=1 Tax=Sphaerisporangium sp. NPDC005289 TaxID=3155247 RepID=UPI0033A940E3